MRGVTTFIHVNGPVEEVFNVFSNIPSAADRIPGITRIEMLSEGAVGRGTRWRETRVMFGKEATEEMEITQFTPRKSYTVEAESCGNHYVTTFTFTPDSQGTQVEMRFESRPVGALMKIFSPLLWILMAGTIKKCIDADMKALKGYVEGQQSPV